MGEGPMTGKKQETNSVHVHRPHQLLPQAQKNFWGKLLMTLLSNNVHIMGHPIELFHEGH